MAPSALVPASSYGRSSPEPSGLTGRRPLSPTALLPAGYLGAPSPPPHTRSRPDRGARRAALALPVTHVVQASRPTSSAKARPNLQPACCDNAWPDSKAESTPRVEHQDERLGPAARLLASPRPRRASSELLHRPTLLAYCEQATPPLYYVTLRALDS
ncbi:hypothetical protein ZWY2020_005997 [Hordeum vulgare]|nr:hypothetical protein ZWY2020_005997 [Hordeum vulgare]